jgi:hypothetical protein
MFALIQQSGVDGLKNILKQHFDKVKFANCQALISVSLLSIDDIVTQTKKSFVVPEICILSFCYIEIRDILEVKISHYRDIFNRQYKKSH